MSLRGLKLAIAVFACVPVLAGALGIIKGLSLIGLPGDISQESHMRYLSGLLLGIGIAFWSTIGSIEREGRLFSVLAAMVFLGGLARLLSVGLDGPPNGPMIFGLVMELVVMPAMWFWQRHESKAAHRFDQ